MKILTLDHIGIAVEKIDASLPVWEGILGLPLHGIEEVAEQKVKTAFMPMGESEIELLETTDPEGPIGKFLAAKGQGVHHRCLPRGRHRRSAGRTQGQGGATHRRDASVRRGRGADCLHSSQGDGTACLSSSANERKIRPNLLCLLFRKETS